MLEGSQIANDNIGLMYQNSAASSKPRVQPTPCGVNARHAAILTGFSLLTLPPPPVRQRKLSHQSHQPLYPLAQKGEDIVPARLCNIAELRGRRIRMKGLYAPHVIERTNAIDCSLTG